MSYYSALTLIPDITAAKVVVTTISADGLGSPPRNVIFAPFASLYANPDKPGEAMLYLDKSIREDALRDRVKALIFPLHDKRSGATIGGIGF